MRAKKKRENKFEVGDRVKIRDFRGVRTGVVVALPGMREYDMSGYLAAERGMQVVVPIREWVFQEDVTKINEKSKTNKPKK